MQWAEVQSKNKYHYCPITVVCMCDYLSQDNTHFSSFKAGALDNYPEIADSLSLQFNFWL